MPKNSLKIKIAHIYPDILQGYCDEANINAFCKRAKYRDIETSIDKIYYGDKIQTVKYDFIYVGGTSLQNVDVALQELEKYKDELLLASSQWVPMLLVNTGYLLFGNTIQLKNAIQIDGLKIFNTNAIEVLNNFFGPIHGYCPFLRKKTIAGFENHAILTKLSPNAHPFFIVQKGRGNNGKDRTEGVKFNNVIGTNLTSPILAQNPHLCDYFISSALKIKYKCKIPLTRLSDDIEWYSHDFIIDSK